MKHTEAFMAVLFKEDCKEIKSAQTLNEMQGILGAEAIKVDREHVTPCHLYRIDLYGARVPENTVLLMVADEIHAVVNFLKRNIR